MPRFEVHTTGETEWDGTILTTSAPMDEPTAAAWAALGKYLTPIEEEG